MTDTQFDDQMTVGFVRGSHGLSGEFKVESASGRYDHISLLKEVTLRQNDISKSYQVEYAEGNEGAFYMKLAGIDSPEAANRLNKSEIRVSREFACPLNKDEWYVEDLKKCSLVYENNGNGLAEGSAPILVGSITDVLEGGAGDLLEVSLSESCDILSDEVKFTSSGKPRTVLVPLVKEHIGKVDVKGRTVQLMHLWILE